MRTETITHRDFSLACRLGWCFVVIAACISWNTDSAAIDVISVDRYMPSDRLALSGLGIGLGFPEMGLYETGRCCGGMLVPSFPSHNLPPLRVRSAFISDSLSSIARTGAASASPDCKTADEVLQSSVSHTGSGASSASAASLTAFWKPPDQLILSWHLAENELDVPPAALFEQIRPP